MNEAIKAIAGRRSHRAYLPEQLKEEHLSAILKAGAFAPLGDERPALEIHGCFKEGAA